MIFSGLAAAVKRVFASDYEIMKPTIDKIVDGLGVDYKIEENDEEGCTLSYQRKDYDLAIDLEGNLDVGLFVYVNITPKFNKNEVVSLESCKQKLSIRDNLKSTGYRRNKWNKDAYGLPQLSYVFHPKTSTELAKIISDFYFPKTE